MDIQNNNRIAKNTMFLYVRMFFVLIVTLYTSRVVLKTLGVVDFGVNNVVAGFVTMFSFLNSSLTGAIQRYYNFERSKNGEAGVQRVYQSSIIIQVAMALMLLMVLELFGLWYVNNVMVIPAERMFAANVLFQVSILSLVLLIISIPYSSAIVSFERMDYYAFVGIADVVLKLLIVMALPLLGGDKLIVYSCLLFCISLMNFLLYFTYAKKHFPALKFRGILNRELTISMLVFSGWNFFGTFSNVVYQQGVNLLLNFFFGPVVNAARGLSNYVSSAVQGFSSNIVVAFRPQLVESYAIKNYARTKIIMFSEAKICYLMLLLLITPVIIEINYILKLWLGEEIPDHTVSFTILILIQMLLVNMNVPFSQIVHATGIMKKFQIITGSITCLIIPIGWMALRLGAPSEMVFVIAIILAIASQVACIILVREIFDYGVADYIKQVVLPLAFATITIPILPYILHILLPISFLRLVLIGLASVVMAVMISYFVVLNSGEKELVKKLVRKKFKR